MRNCKQKKNIKKSKDAVLTEISINQYVNIQEAVEDNKLI